MEVPLSLCTALPLTRTHRKDSAVFTAVDVFAVFFASFAFLLAFFPVGGSRELRRRLLLLLMPLRLMLLLLMCFTPRHLWRQLSFFTAEEQLSSFRFCTVGLGVVTGCELSE